MAKFIVHKGMSYPSLAEFPCQDGSEAAWDEAYRLAEYTCLRLNEDIQAAFAAGRQSVDPKEARPKWRPAYPTYYVTLIEE